MKISACEILEEERQTRIKRSTILAQAFKVFRKYLEPVGCSFGEIQKRENGSCHFIVHRPVSMKVETLKAVLEGYGELVVSQQSPEAVKVSVSVVAAGRWNNNDQYLIQKFVDNHFKIAQQNEKNEKKVTTVMAVGGLDKMEVKQSMKQRVKSFLEKSTPQTYFHNVTEKRIGIVSVNFKDSEDAVKTYVLGEDFFGKGLVLYKEGSKTVTFLSSPEMSSQIGKRINSSKPEVIEVSATMAEFKKALEVLNSYDPDKVSQEIVDKLWDRLRERFGEFKIFVRVVSEGSDKEDNFRLNKEDFYL